MQYLKQSTAVTLKIGPFLDDTDGKTAETGLTIAQADVRLSKNGANIAQKTEATSCTHDELGIYGCPVDATDTATLGRLQLWIHESGALPVWHEYLVVPANIYDSLFSTDKLEVDIIQIGGVAQSATDLKDFADTGYDPSAHRTQALIKATDDIDLSVTQKTSVNSEVDSALNTAIPGSPVAHSINERVKAVDEKLPSATYLRGTADADGGLCAADKTDINAEVDTALSDINLDHLCKTATVAADMTAEVVDNSILSRVLASGDTSAFVPTTDSLQDIRDKLTDIETDTAEIGAAGASLTDLGGMSTGMKAEIESEANDALVALKLDHLVAVADADDPVNDSIIAKMAASDGDWSGFDKATDALEALRDRGDAAWTTGAGGSDRLLMVDTTIATLASQTSFTLTAGSADDDAYNNCTIVIEDASTATQKAVGIISNYVGASKTVTLKYDPAIFTMATTDKVYILAENALKSTLANRQLNVAADGDVAGNVDGSVGSVTADVGITQAGADKVWGTAARALTDKAGFSLATAGITAIWEKNISAFSGAGYAGTYVKTLYDDWLNGGRLDLILDIIAADVVNIDGDAMRGTDSANTTTPPTVGEIADQVWDEILTGATHNIATSAGRRVREMAAFAVESGTAQAGTATTITLEATADGGDGIFNRNLIVLVGGTGAGQTRTIADYNNTSKVCVIDREWRINPNATSEYQILAEDTPLIVDHGIAQAGTLTTITLRDYASATNDAYLCNIIAIIGGTGRGQARLVGSYVGATKVVTICGDNWVTTPDTTSVYAMAPYGTSCASCMGTTALTEINAECDTALTDYDPPTRTEATADKDAIIVEIDANETKIDTIDTVVDAILIDTGTDGVVVASGSKTGYALSAAGVDAILDEVVEGTTTFRQMMRIFMAALAGKSAGGGTVTLAFRDNADGKDRITATVDASGNRTAMVLDGA